jgi:hypothetical protein
MAAAHAKIHFKRRPCQVGAPCGSLVQSGRLDTTVFLTLS